MDDTRTGMRDDHGAWAPKDPLAIAPIYRLPPRPLEVLRWLPSYLWPWNVVFAASALVFWVWLTPSMETMTRLAPGWVLWVFLVNAVAVLLFYGAFELQLYVRRGQGTRFKYNPAFPGDRKSSFFWFGNQNADGAARTFLFGVPIWSAWQIFALWAFANGWGQWVDPATHWPWLLVVAFLLPAFHELHFYCIHRLIHTPFLYKWVHSVHHRSVNPSPWSSLSMHPVEHLLYFSSVLIHLIIPSHPILALFQLHRAGFGAIPGHIGFDTVEIGEARGVDIHGYGHYLHHKYFEVNYGDGLVPLDKLFGTWHDGSEEAAARMRARLKARRRAAR